MRRVARVAGVGPGDHVLEIGAGLGSLSLALAETGAAVTAVETDRHLLPALREVLAGTSVDVVEGDALELDWGRVLAGADRWVLVANLPYNVATPLVLDLLDDVPRVQRMLVMVQREAGERLVAEPGTGAYGLPTVKVDYWATARIVGRVPPSVFHPTPRVDSVLLHVERRSEPACRRRARRVLPSGAGGVRPASQDAPPLPRGGRRRGRLRDRRRPSRGTSRGAGGRGLVPPGRGHTPLTGRDGVPLRSGRPWTPRCSAPPPSSR
ncbi:MAG: rRNA adenine dimethyltransferase family protein [Acidimicrobiia bacterium]|nr:rRNA adenine dimethyltransferase family protein [Acidimicrobiia bacterium]